MKILKSQVVLFLYDELLQGHTINIDAVTTDYEISTRTFMRYISDIRAYLSNFNIAKELVYDTKKRAYTLR